MTADPLSRDAALARCREAGREAGLFGAPAKSNPYTGKSSMRQEHDAWASGWQIGAAERKVRRSHGP